MTGMRAAIYNSTVCLTNEQSCVLWWCVDDEISQAKGRGGIRASGDSRSECAARTRGRRACGTGHHAPSSAARRHAGQSDEQRMRQKSWEDQKGAGAIERGFSEGMFRAEQDCVVFVQSRQERELRAALCCACSSLISFCVSASRPLPG